MAGGVWSTYCDHALQSRRKLADFCEKIGKLVRFHRFAKKPPFEIKNNNQVL
jgi:hypothetical protein